MTREEVRGIVEGISDEQLKKILDINSADIGKAKKGADDLQKELDAANKAVEKLTEENLGLKESQYEAEEMKNKVAELQKVIDDRKSEDEKAAKEAELVARFETATGGAEFLNEFTRNGVFDCFSKALDAQENRGKSDAEIFEAITSASGNIFATDSNAPSILASTSGFGADLSMGEVREIMGLDPLK